MNNGATHNAPGGSGGGGGAWEDEWYPRHELEKPIRWWWHGTAVDIINMGDVLSKERTDAFSVSFRFRAHNFAAANAGRFIAKATTNDSIQRGWLVTSAGVVGGKFIQFGLINTGATNCIRVQTTAEFQEDRDYSVLCTYDGSVTAAGVTIYVDGVAAAVTVTDDTLTATTLSNAQLCIGNREDGARPYHGAVWDACVWNRELTASEAEDVHDAVDPTLLAFAADLEACWLLDDSDTTGASGIVDQSGNGLHGTAQGLVTKGMHIVHVGAEANGGLGTTGTTNTANAGIAGTAGNPSMFGYLLSAYGGGRGTTNPTTGGHTVGGSGGGTLGPGPNSSGTGTTVLGGEPSSFAGVAGLGGGGGSSPTPGFVVSSTPEAARPAIKGGGPGGFSLASGAGRPGGKSRKGGGGGGPGGGSNLGQNGNPGGRSGAPLPTDIWGPFGGDGGVNGDGTITLGVPTATSGGHGNPGTDDHAGDGGGGGGAGLGVGATGGHGGDGGVPGGGGGGGGTAVYQSGAAVTSGNGGKGARGEVRVYKYG